MKARETNRQEENEQSISVLWDSFYWPNMYVTELPRGGGEPQKIAEVISNKI